MKILKYFLYVVVAIVIIFLAIGLLNPSVNYGHEIIANKSIKEAWAVHKDESKLGEWLELDFCYCGYPNLCYSYWVTQC